MKKWKDYLEFEKKHTENVENTVKHFEYVLQNLAGEPMKAVFENILEIGPGLSGGYLPLLRGEKKVSVDPLYGDLKIKAEDMDFEPGTFDLVIISNTLSHCENPELVAKKSINVLSKGGLLMLFNYFNEDNNHPHSYQNSQEILDLFPGMKVLKYSEQKIGRNNPSVFILFEKI